MSWLQEPEKTLFISWKLDLQIEKHESLYITDKVDNLSPFFTEKKKGKGFCFSKSKGKNKKKLWWKIEWDLQRLDWQRTEDETESEREGGEDEAGDKETKTQRWRHTIDFLVERGGCLLSVTGGILPHGNKELMCWLKRGDFTSWICLVWNWIELIFLGCWGQLVWPETWFFSRVNF